MLDCLRACNVAVRWLMLATASRQAALAESVRAAAPDHAAVAALLLDTSLLEYEVTEAPLTLQRNRGGAQLFDIEYEVTSVLCGLFCTRFLPVQDLLRVCS